MLKLGFVFEKIILLNAVTAAQLVVSLVNEDEKAVEKRVNELVFVGQERFVVINVKYL